MPIFSNILKGLKIAFENWIDENIPADSYNSAQVLGDQDVVGNHDYFADEHGN